METRTRPASPALPPPRPPQPPLSCPRPSRPCHAPAPPTPACRAPSGQPGVSTLEALGSRVSWDSRQAGTQPGAKTHPLQETGAPPCGAGEHEGLHVGCMPSPHPPPVRAPSPRAHPKAWSSPCRPTRYSPMSVVSSRNFRNPGSHSPPRLRAVGAPGPEPGGPRGPRRSSPHPRMAY